MDWIGLLMIPIPTIAALCVYQISTYWNSREFIFKRLINTSFPGFYQLPAPYDNITDHLFNTFRDYLRAGSSRAVTGNFSVAVIQAKNENTNLALFVYNYFFVLKYLSFNLINL